MTSEKGKKKESASCCCKKTVRSEEERKKLIHRLKRIEGQIRGLEGMVENDAYCNDILIQSAAVTAALHSFNRDLIERHLRLLRRERSAGGEGRGHRGTDGRAEQADEITERTGKRAKTE